MAGTQTGMEWLALLAFVLGSAALVSGGLFYRRRFLGSGWGWLWFLGAITAAGVLSVNYYMVFRNAFLHSPMRSNWDEVERFLMVLAHGAVVLFAVPLALRLFNKWTGPALTEAEKAPGGVGVRAWLGAGHITLAVLVSLGLWWGGYGISFWVALALVMGLVVAYPVINMLSHAGGTPAPAAAPADLSGERERILRLLEENKITAAESAELISALGETVPAAPPVAAATTPGRKLLLIGGGLVLVGFFLPWFTVDLSQEMNRAMESLGGAVNGMQGTMNNMMSGMQNQMRQTTPGMPTPPPMPAMPDMSGAVPSMTPGQPVPVHTVTLVHVSGGNVRDHLGWLVLLLGLGAAVLPYLAANITPATRKTLTLLALCGGAIVLAYLLSAALQWVSVGIFVVIGGYVLEIVGAVREQKA